MATTKEKINVLRILFFLLMLSGLHPTGAALANNRHEEVVATVATRTGYREEIVIKRYETKVSWYGPGFHGRRTTSGRIFDQNDPTMAACPWRKMLKRRVRVTNPENGKAIVVTCWDLGPDQDEYPDRGLDLAKAGAEALGFIDRGVAILIVEELA